MFKFLYIACGVTLICYVNMKYPVGTYFCTRNFAFKLFHVLLTVEVQILFLIPYYIYHKLAKLEQTWMIRTTQTIGLFDKTKKKPVHYITISEISFAPF